MKVLVATASRHGATKEIAQAIAVRLRERGHDVDVADPADVTSLVGYGAVVLGSAVYAGNWMKYAREFASRNADALSHARVWLFSSGPLDDPTSEVLSSARLDALTTTTGSRDHHVFAGRLDRSELNRAERLLTKMVHAPDGDFRDWDDVARWSDQIADALPDSTVQSASRPPAAHADIQHALADG
jgi:menaquinone-dependent protoporphyrinogen oxidase